MLKREQARVLALQALYQWDLRGEEFAQTADEFLAESTQDSEVYFFARELAFGTWNFREKSDVLIREAAAHWDVGRMAAVDRNILRLAVFGLLLIWFRDWITDRFGPTTATLGTVPTGYASFVAVIGWTLFLAPGLWWLIIGGMLAAS